MSIMLPWAISTPAGSSSWVPTACSTLAVSWLAITGSSVNMASLLGLVMLEGIVVNNAIVLIDYVNVLRRENNVAAGGCR